MPSKTTKQPLIFVTLACASVVSNSGLQAEGLQLSLVNRDTVSERLRQGEVPAKVRQSVVERLFAESGCEARTQAIDKKSSNVICDLPGQTNATIVVGAHLDFVEKGQGIVDDWSGVSLLVSLYQTLKFQNPKHSYEFVAFAGEERGLLGSTRYVKELNARPGPPTAFVNLECLGLTPPKVWVTRSNPVLVRKLLEIASAVHISVEGVNVDNVGDDDTHPFFSKKIPVISIHSITQEKWKILHSPNDNIKAIDPGQYYNAYRLVAFYLDYLDSQL